MCIRDRFIVPLISDSFDELHKERCFPLCNNDSSYANIDQLLNNWMATLSSDEVVVGNPNIVRKFGISVRDPAYSCVGQSGRGFIGVYKNGLPTGVCWQQLIGCSWLYGEVDDYGEFTGDNIAYIYPDLHLALLGTFSRGLMITGREVEIIGCQCLEGIMTLQFSPPIGPEFHYNPPSKNSFGDQPYERDPLDKKYTYLAPSVDMPLAGEGAWATRDIPAGTTVMLSAGLILTSREMEELNRKYRKDILEEKGLSENSTEFTNTWMYRDELPACKFFIDIPPEFGSSDTYRSTLGHKVNHKFPPKNNCEYSWIDSARFGPIMTIKTIGNISRGQELFANYGYWVQTEHRDLNLPWYTELYERHVEDGYGHVDVEWKDLDGVEVNFVNLEIGG